MRKKRMLSLFLCLLTILGVFATAASAGAAGKYDAEWEYWSQGVSGISSLKSGGCLIVAEAKLLVEAGIANESNFDPDIYKKAGSTAATTAPVKYADKNGKELYYCKKEYFPSGSSVKERDALIMSWLEKGYYVILSDDIKPHTHHTYVMREKSLDEGTAWISDSSSSSKYPKGKILKYTAYKDWTPTINFSYVRLYTTDPTLAGIEVSVTTDRVESLTETSATLYGSVSSTGAKVTEVGMYFGTSEDNMTKLGFDKVNTYSCSMWYPTGKYGKTLKPGTTYYFKAYAVVGNRTYYAGVKSFTTPGSAPPTSTPKPTQTQEPAGISLDKSSMTMQDNVCNFLRATTTPSGQKVTWKSSNPSVAWVHDGVVEGRSAGTTTITASMYYNGATYLASCRVTVKSSKPEPPAPTQTPAPAPTQPQPSISVSYVQDSRHSVGSNNATLAVKATVSGTSTKNVTEVGMDLYDSAGRYLGGKSESVSFSGRNNYFSIWYDVRNRLGYTLSSGTTYQYRFYCVINNTKYTSAMMTFTTQGSSSNTRTGVVTGTSGKYLAINDAPAASPKYSTQVGRVPPGGTVTVYPDRTSGNWYWVTYNGVSGYVYKNYISLK